MGHVQMCTKVKARTRDKASGIKNIDGKSMAQDIFKQVTQARAHAIDTCMLCLLYRYVETVGGDVLTKL